MAITLRDNLYKSITNSMWVCLIEGRIMVGNGVRSYNKCAFTTKAAAALVFKNTPYWRYIAYSIEKEHPNTYGKELNKILDKEYKRLLKEGIVKYLQVSPIPDWVN